MNDTHIRHQRRRTTSLLLFLISSSVCRGWVSSNSAFVLATTRRAYSVNPPHAVPDDDDQVPVYYEPRNTDLSMLGDMTGGRPGAIVETEEQLAIKEKILREIDNGQRIYPDWMKNYGELAQDEEDEYDTDDPEALDSTTLGQWTIQDINSKFDYEWHPRSGEPDPNLLELNQEGVEYLAENEKDDDGVEVGYDPMFGPSNPIDKRTILGTKDSYMIDDKTRDDSMLTPEFTPGDPEIMFNSEFVRFRKSLDILETYIDPFLEIEVPRHVAKWHGYPEKTNYEPKNYTNNRFTENPTNFDELTPFRARQRAVEMARAKNAEWLQEGVSKEWHRQQREPYELYGTLVGTLRRGHCDPEVVDQIQPALKVLGSCVDLLSIDSNIFRFHYYGLMKNRHGMSCWAKTLIEDCGVEVSNVIFETGFRKRDRAYDGGDPWSGPTV